MSTFYIGLKMGSNETCIYKQGEGIVLREASLIAMPTNMKIREIKAVGNQAKKLIGKVPESITVYSPISNGVIAYDELCTQMLKCFIKKVFPNKTLGQNIKAILTVPLGITVKQKKQFETTCFKAGIAEVFIIPESFADAIGAGRNIQDEAASMVVNIGSDLTNISIIAGAQIVKGISLNVGGSILNRAIVKQVEDKFDTVISYEQAEQIKTEICSLFDNYSAEIEIFGLNKKTQLSEKIILKSQEFSQIVKHYYKIITDAINSILGEVNPETFNDIAKNGLILCGKGSLIIGFEKFISITTSLSVDTITDSSGISGTSDLIKYPGLLRKIIKNT